MNRLEKMVEFYNTLNVDNLDIAYFADESHESFDDLQQSIENGGGFDVEIIYYGSAMDYLREHDPSLNESLRIAADMGFTPDKLNSEVLASLLATEVVMEEFYELENEIEDFFYDLSSEDEEEE